MRPIAQVDTAESDIAQIIASLPAHRQIRDCDERGLADTE